MSDLTMMDNLIEGLQILRKYTPDDVFGNVAAAHDTIWAGPHCKLEDYDEWDDDDVPKDKYGEIEYVDTQLSKDEHKRMLELGWHIDVGNDCWEFGV